MTGRRCGAHGISERDGGEAHQTETHGAARRRWDAELVPDARGRTRGPEPGCPVETALAAVSGRWTTLVLRELMHGAHSFGDLREALPRISPKVLAERLRALEERGLVTRDRLRGFPVRTRYRLTPAGRALRPLLIELYRTGSALAEERGGDR
ncbi:helix-turn-helix domain-containing protein [Streptomyces sp. DSM 41886]|uniref:Helix-turn-helix domain-containing protein n=1 Tax=Streptomyces johnsoniae TaxID=3075532 RepID=A0ABU2S1J7_9ACTN|nr:helix-turn-helix domain-containing protein [Streptomyces sp. DSM 41886]MDT0442871.1 helix-turn-helix domain-containing protein [Streptomyces sp. DSM 41886]